MDTTCHSWFGIDKLEKFVTIVAAIVPCILNSYLAISEQPKDMIAAKNYGSK